MQKNIFKDNDPYRVSRVLYIIEAAIEYFISILFADSYLAKITTAIGMSDSLIGVLSAFVSLGCGMQIVAIFLTGRDSVKRIVCAGTIITNISFMVVYMTPFIPVENGTRSMILLVILLLAHLIKNIVHSPKMNWFMSLVDDSKRGVFTANKEIISLIGGMVFTLAMGALIDMFELAGNLNGAFIACAFTVFVLSVVHILTLVFSKEKKIEEEKTESTEKSKKLPLKELFSNKNLLKVIIFSILWHIAHYATTPFYGAYKNNVLGFTMLFNSVLSIAYSIIRALCSRPLGRFADRKSFATMLIICFAIISLAFGINIFTVPSNGYVMFTIYYILFAVAMAGINSGTVNLVYDYVPHNQRVAALALQNSIAGIIGFLTTTVVSLLVDYIQESGNVFLGMKVYAPQVVSAIGFIMVIVTELYLVFVISKIKREKESL
ncbi:MAG: MFS transporter [Ruminococcaceae bacterium]|nr:MFS transporter [Oscillospiraceae bacterium]